MVTDWLKKNLIYHYTEGDKLRREQGRGQQASFDLLCGYKPGLYQVSRQLPASVYVCDPEGVVSVLCNVITHASLWFMSEDALVSSLLVWLDSRAHIDVLVICLVGISWFACCLLRAEDGRCRWRISLRVTATWSSWRWPCSGTKRPSGSRSTSCTGCTASRSTWCCRRSSSAAGARSGGGAGSSRGARWTCTCASPPTSASSSRHRRQRTTGWSWRWPSAVVVVAAGAGGGAGMRLMRARPPLLPPWPRSRTSPARACWRRRRRRTPADRRRIRFRGRCRRSVSRKRRRRWWSSRRRGRHGSCSESASRWRDVVNAFVGFQGFVGCIVLPLHFKL